MPAIYLSTKIQAPIERVFDLSRSITLHTVSMAHTNEKAIGGVTKGLINQGETVTWSATHLFKTRYLKTIISHMSPYTSFTDEMVEGDFVMIKHQHLFTSPGDVTIMNDIFIFKTPYGLFGKLANRLFLKRYMKRLLEKRNLIIKEFAETDKWMKVLV